MSPHILLTPVAAALANASSTPSPDKVIREARSIRHPILAWYCVAAFILLLSLYHVLCLVYQLVRRVPSPGNVRPRGVIYYSRLPAAAIHTFRALALRWTLPIGKSYTLNVVEVFTTVAYMAILLFWSFINCMLLPRPQLLVLTYYAP